MYLEKIKFFLQRVFRGYSDYDICNLNKFIVNIVRDPLKMYVKHQSENGMYLPKDLETNPAEWLVRLKDIEYALDFLYKKYNNLCIDESYNKLENVARINKGMQYFGRYLTDLFDYNYENIRK